MKKILFYHKAFLVWRMKHISHRNFMLMLSFVVGIVSGLAAVLLKNVVHYVGVFVTTNKILDDLNWWMLFLPMTGILLTVFYVQLILKDDIKHGVSKVLYAISKGGGKLKRSKSYSSMVASALTVGFGGSVGLEAPIVLTGSAIGSNIGQAMRLDYRSLILMVACGATGAVAGIFKAPLAGVVFALEVLLIDLTMSSIIPLLISGCTAAVLSSFLLGKDVLFSFDIHAGFALRNVGFYVILGIFTGLVSLYFTRASHKLENLLKNIKNIWIKAVLGGFLVSILIFFFPPLFGEGFTTLTDIISGNSSNMVNNSFFYVYKDSFWTFLGFLILILFFKVIAMSFTNGSGGVGGVFAPSLFMGGVAGAFISRFFNGVFHTQLPESNFALAGMAGVMAGVMHAPLTAIFLIAEITGGYQLFIPLIITATISFLTHYYFEKYSVYTKKLAESGDLITHHKDRAALTMMSLGNLIEKDFYILHDHESLRDIVKGVSASNRNIFPVLDKDENFAGLVLLNDVRNIMFDRDLYDKVKVKDLMIHPESTIQEDEDMETVVNKFKHSDNYNIIVLQGRKFSGVVSRANLFSSYRKHIQDFSAE